MAGEKDLGALLPGWRLLDPAAAASLEAELARELAPGHSLEGLAVTALAARGANDDVLYRHSADPERFTIVHLTWSSRRERDPAWPSIEADGSLADILAYEQRWRRDDAPES